MPYTYFLEKPEEGPSELFHGTDIVQTIVWESKGSRLAPRGIESLLQELAGRGSQVMNKYYKWHRCIVVDNASSRQGL